MSDSDNEVGGVVNEGVGFVKTNDKGGGIHVGEGVWTDDII